MVAEPEELEVAVRGWATSPSRSDRPTFWIPQLPDQVGPSDWVLVFDCETTTDHVQRLRFGGWHSYLSGQSDRQGLFYDPDAVTDEELGILKQAAGDLGLELHTVAEWIERAFMPLAVDLSATVVGHNLFFDLTRIAIGHDTTRSRDPRMRGGFSLKLTEDLTRPRVLVKRASASTTFIQFTVPDGRSPEQRQQEKGFDLTPYRGFFVDTTVLANALLGEKLTLARLAETLGTKHRKTSVDLDGPVTTESIDYCLNDVTVTWECFGKLADRYASYKLDVPVHRILSEASVGKAHLAQMRIRSWRQVQPEFPDWLIAVLMETYFGGRSECHIRRSPTKGTYVDFLSEYPTVYCLQDLWRYQIATSIIWEEVDPEGVNEFLATVEVDDLLEPETWRDLDCVVQIAPDGDLLPTRARYKPGSPLYNVGLAHRYGVDGWWTLADAIVAKIQSDNGTAPKVVRAIRFKPGPVQGGMRPIQIAGRADFKIDPYCDDFIQRLIELRAQAKSYRDRAKAAGDPEADLWDGVQHGLKITANSVSYGIGIEFNPITHRKPQPQILHHTDGTSDEFLSKVTEGEGSWFDPLVATLTAAGGRLLLAILIRLVRDLGGDYVICDTDSLFISGLPDGQITQIIDQFERLNPYHPEAVPESILKLEDINYNPGTDQLRDLYAYSIASKRYALLTQKPDGTYRLAHERDARGTLAAKRSEHGLGHLVAPTGGFEDELWEWIVNTDVGNDWPEPTWFDQPALGRTTINTPYDLNLFRELNRDPPYQQQVRPGGFLTLAHAHPIEAPGLLVAPYSRTPDEAMARKDWIQRGTWTSWLSIRTERPEYAIDGCIAVLDYRHYSEQYLAHREWKGTLTAGQVILPRHIVATGITQIGKEVGDLRDLTIPVTQIDAATTFTLRACHSCGADLVGRQQRWCSVGCRKRFERSSD